MGIQFCWICPFAGTPFCIYSMLHFGPRLKIFSHCCQQYKYLFPWGLNYFWSKRFSALLIKVSLALYFWRLASLEEKPKPYCRTSLVLQNLIVGKYLSHTISLEPDEASTCMEVRMVFKVLCTLVLTGRLVQGLEGKLYWWKKHHWTTHWEGEEATPKPWLRALRVLAPTLQDGL